MPAPVEPEDVEVLGELGHVLLESPRVRQSGVKQHERLARAVLLVIGVHVTELYVIGHLIGHLPLLSSSGLWAGVANQDHRVVERPRCDERAFKRHLELAEERVRSALLQHHPVVEDDAAGVEHLGVQQLKGEVPGQVVLTGPP
jgi:hypothetical protein